MIVLATALLSTLPGTFSPLPDVFVDANAANCGSGTGSATSPVCSIADAIGLAVAGDTIRIAPGTYVENVSIGFDLDLVGTGGADVTIVDGGASGSVITIPSTVTVSIDGLTVTNGVANFGAGILCDGTLLLSNSTVHSNFTDASADTQQGGAGIGTSGYGIPGEFLIENCTIRDNHALSTGNAAGGGIFLGAGSMVLTNSTVRSNRANGDVLGQGGGVFAFGNRSISVYSDVLVRDCTISGNEATSGIVFSYGGGISAGAGDFFCLSSTVADNVAQLGGGVQISGALASLRNMTLSGNTATLIGGGFLASLTVEGSSISHSTVTQNTAPQGAGIGSSAAPVVVDVRNTIVAQNNNTNPFGEGEVTGGFSSLGHNLLGTGGPGFSGGVNGDQAGTSAQVLEAGLAPLADNGGTTATHALLPGSPAIDKGSNAVFDATDQRGVLRPQGLRPDVGAFEVEGTTVSFCSGDGGDGLGCTDCPCGNNAVPGTTGGCVNSVGQSARLEVIGSTSVSLPARVTSDLRFSLIGATPRTFGMLFSSTGTEQSNPALPCFGLNSGRTTPLSNGLNCISGPLAVHGIRRTHTNGSVGLSTLPWGGEGGPVQGLAQSPQLVPVGQTRYFQAIYRDESFDACGTRLNSSQGVEITFTP